MKKFLVFMFAFILLVGTISAAEFDNIKIYDPETKTVTIKNSVLGIPFLYLDTVATVKLDTPLNYHVAGGYQKVAQFTITSYEEYNDALKELELFDKTKGMKKFTRDYDYKSLSYETILVNDYQEVCNKIISINGSSRNECSKILSGTHEEQKEVWTKLTPANLKKNDVVTIGIFTEVKEEDVVEWIPNFFGIRVEEWATWTYDLNTGLTHSYKFNETSGTNAVESVFGIQNGTITSGVTINQTNAVSGRSYLFLGEATPPTLNIPSGVYPNEFTISLWIRPQAGGDSTAQRIFQGVGGNTLGMSLEGVGGNQLYITGGGGGSWLTSFKRTLNQWDHLVYRVNATHESLYVNGVLNSTNASTKTITSQTYRIGSESGGNRNFAGLMDELHFWNRSLTESEVLYLYQNNATYEEITDFILVTLNTPTDNEIILSGSVDFNCSANVMGANLTNISLWHNGTGTWELNQTETISGGNQSTKVFTSTLPEGNTLWTCQACDSDNDCEFAGSNRTVTVDLTNPSVTISSPTKIINSHVIGNNLSLNWSVTDANLDSCWYNYNGTNNTLTCSANTTSFATTSQKNLTFYANDTGGNLNTTIHTWDYNFLEESINFNANVSETSRQSFELNLSTGINILSVSSNLIYNGTSYPSTSSCNLGECSLINTLDVPLVQDGQSQLNEFYWDFNIYNGTDSININTSTNEQNVSKIYIEICNSTYNQNTLNFTAYDEKTRIRINNYSFQGTFDFWVGGGTIKKNNSYSNNDTNTSLCLFPKYETMKVDSIINYDENGNLSKYVSRFYYLDNHSINNITQEIHLFLLESSSSTSFILKVEDENLLQIAGAFIEIHRYYPGTGEFEIVQISKTDENGKSIGFFETESVDYKFIIKKGGVTLLETTQQKVVPETSPYTLTFNTGGEFGTPWDSQEQLGNLTSNLYHNKTSNTVQYTYIDTSGNLTNSSLRVLKRNLGNLSGYELICNKSSTLSSATLTCSNITEEGFYVASGYITRGTTTTLDSLINFQIEGVSETLGVLGLFLGWFIILISSSLFIYNEIAGIWGVTISIFIVNLIGLIKFGSVFVTAIIAIAIIISWVLER